ncbi:hypothetical protein PoB_001436400 [Plakobranchus ocellatus]|uniref:Uncharacterized protein n=1 Tax=Plakobranchus ocellatus TaxID=259542 RepID=A0AAV3Z0C6_9GAST|nr:hypothetical protein PoB_001436400 [Plakobranchus ocellatus]
MEAESTDCACVEMEISVQSNFRRKWHSDLPVTNCQRIASSHFYTRLSASNSFVPSLLSHIQFSKPQNGGNVRMRVSECKISVVRYLGKRQIGKGGGFERQKREKWRRIG